MAFLFLLSISLDIVIIASTTQRQYEVREKWEKKIVFKIVFADCKMPNEYWYVYLFFREYRRKKLLRQNIYRKIFQTNVKYFSEYFSRSMTLRMCLRYNEMKNTFNILTSHSFLHIAREHFGMKRIFLTRSLTRSLISFILIRGGSIKFQNFFLRLN